MRPIAINKTGNDAKEGRVKSVRLLRGLGSRSAPVLSRCSASPPPLPHPPNCPSTRFHHIKTVVLSNDIRIIRRNFKAPTKKKKLCNIFDVDEKLLRDDWI